MSKIKNHLSDIDSDITISDAVLEDNGSTMHLFIRTKEHPRMCPHCGSQDCSINDSGRRRTIKHLPQSRKPCRVTFTQRRYICNFCQATFMEHLDWLHPSLGITWDLYHAIIKDLSHSLSMKEIARINGISEYYVSRVVRSIHISHPEHLPEVVSLDETAGDTFENSSKSSRIKYVTNFSDGRSGELLDILPYRTIRRLRQYFLNTYDVFERRKVRFLTCDMGKEYLNLAKSCFPNAKVCLDNFHVVRSLNYAVDKVRIKEQDRLLDNSEEASYKDLKNLGRSLKVISSHQKYKWRNRYDKTSSRILRFLELSPELKDAYAMLQYYHEITHNYMDLDMKIEQLLRWIRVFEKSTSVIVYKAVKTIKDHLPYILNAWKNQLSNSVCEGNNNGIKAIKKFSFGIHRFSYLRTRSLLIYGSPGVDRNKKKKRSIPEGSSFFDWEFPDLEEYELAYDWSFRPGQERSFL